MGQTKLQPSKTSLRELMPFLPAKARIAVGRFLGRSGASLAHWLAPEIREMRFPSGGAVFLPPENSENYDGNSEKSDDDGRA